jgi:hypothetical protein
MQQAHEKLLDLTHALEVAADAGDEEAVERLSVVALRELAIHLDDERLMGIKLDAVEPDLAARLEQRRRLIVERLLALSDEPGLADDTCRCAALADEVIALLGEEVAAEEAAIDTYQLPATGPRHVLRPPGTASSPTTGSP